MPKLINELVIKYKSRFESYGEDSSRETFYGELNYLSGKIFYIVFITLFLMLIYIPGDIKIHPFPALAISIHLGYTLLSAILIALRFTKHFKDRPCILMMVLTAYFFLGTSVLTASSGSNIHTYIGALSVILMLPVFAPFPIKFKIANIAFALIVFFSVSRICGMDFSDYETRYIINDLMVAVAVSLLFSISQDKLRRKSWEVRINQNKLMQEAKNRENLLGMVNSAANVLLSVKDDESFETALSKSFKLVGDCMDVDRVQIWRNEIIDGEMHFVRRFEWLSDYGYRITTPVSLYFPYSWKPEWEKLFLRGGHINAPFSALSQDDQDFLHPYQLKSIVIIPMFLERQIAGDRRKQTVDRRQELKRRKFSDENRQLFIYDRRLSKEDRRQIIGDRRRTKIDRRQATGDEGSFWGFFSINDCRKERVFSDEEIHILTSVGLLMSNAVNRNLQNAKIIKESEKSLAMSHWYKSILNAIPLPISVTDADANWTFINSAVEKLLYVSHKDIIGKPCSYWKSNICNTRECGIECAKRGEKYTYFSNEDSSYEVNVEILKSLDNKTIGYIEVMHDVTNLKKMAKKQADAEAANNAKSAFLARMSHEIRSPMNVILGIAEMQLDKEGLSQDMREALAKVYDSGYLLLSIINDILDLSKIEANKMELTPVNYDVVNLISDTVQLNVMRFDNKPIQFELKADENIPVTLIGDELRIKQILNNILTNAFKYTDSGKVSMAVTAENKMSEQGEDTRVMPRIMPSVLLVFRVSDTGRGMTSEQVAKLFDEYTRFNMEANYATEGTGLGMSITKRLIDLMDGEIIVESELDKGSVFTVKLPQGIVPGAEVIGKELAENINMYSRGKSARVKKSAQIIREYMPYGKVLVVDDMEPNLYVARGLLSPYGLSIETVLSGKEAVEKIKEGLIFDVIFMDHFMPEMDGIETAKIIRGLGYTKPIIALTANAIVGNAEMFAENGFDGFISKPIDIRQLNEILNKLIRDNFPTETVEAARRLKDSLIKKTDAVNLDLSHIKALVVDDFLPNLNVAAGMLRKYKMQVDCVLDGYEAIKRVERGEPVYDIIFMDHQMPDIDGIETALQIRSLDTEYAKNVPIIALTADEAALGGAVGKAVGGAADNAKPGQIFLDNGFQDVLYKPLSFSKIDAFIKNWIREKITKSMDISEKMEKKMDIEIPGIDKNKIMELYDGDMEIFLSVLRSYLSVIPAALVKMRSVSEQTLPEYIISVHGVKSTSESIGVETARKMSAELEALAKAGDLSGVLAKNQACINYIEKLLSDIEAWLNRNKSLNFDI
ncbi:hybrid sensor histidine kinase/response regulator [Treponema sp. R8-4-B8]